MLSKISRWRVAKANLNMANATNDKFRSKKKIPTTIYLDWKINHTKVSKFTKNKIQSIICKNLLDFAIYFTNKNDQRKTSLRPAVASQTLPAFE